ncbi:MAG: hypothetical protein ABI120_07045 [Gemmatimonadaceae bacterium]
MSGAHHHYPTREDFARRLPGKPVPSSLKMASIGLAVLGTAIFLYGVFTGQARAWQALMFNWTFFASISTAGVAFAAVQRIVTARWSRGVVRIAEGMVAFLPIAFVLLLLILFVGKAHIFTWAHETVEVQEKATYLNPTFFWMRGVFLFGAMMLLMLKFVYNSVRMDVAVMPEYGSKWAANIRAGMRKGFGEERRELHSQHSSQGKYGVAVCMAFVIGWCFMAWDYSMTISLHFQQTMYAWIVFMGAWQTMLMVLALLCMWWRKHLDSDDLITIDHFWDLGKLGFAFTAFFGYISFAQYLVIWYGNMPEETFFYRLRLIGVWKQVTQLIPILMFIFPFFGLISKAAKVYLPTFVLFAVATIAGLWLHRYIEVYPSIYGEVATLPLGLMEFGVFAGVLGLWGISYIAFMDAFPVMRVFMMTSKYRDEVQVPVNARTMEPLPAHE